MTQKRLDYADFKKVHAIMVRGEHLTQVGLDSIRDISKGMNLNRKFKF